MPIINQNVFQILKLLNYIVYFFLTTGISTLIAALIGHAFLYHFGKDAKIYGWVLGIFSISFSVIFLALG